MGVPPMGQVAPSSTPQVLPEGSTGGFPHSYLSSAAGRPGPHLLLTHLWGPVPSDSRKRLPSGLEPGPNAPFSIKEA
jgi:hypothetical protein